MGAGGEEGRTGTELGMQCQDPTVQTYCMTLNTALHLHSASVSPFSLHIYPVGLVVPGLW